VDNFVQNPPINPAGPRVWQVGALCRAIADALESRFNPVAVTGEISGFSRAASGHCYFSIKDAAGQLRCAMFRRAAGLLGFTPRDGELVELRGRLGVYEPRGELQLIVENMSRAGQGTLFEQFVKIKLRLEAEGLFDAARKRPVAAMPRGIGVVTSLGAAAWHDVMTALQRRVPHVPVVLAPASVQGENAPRELVQALEALYRLAVPGQGSGVCIDTILLVRGGGAMEDLWAFNDEQLARTIARSPVPVIAGVGHETDFTIADFVADLRAPTPTAAAELAGDPTAGLLALQDDAAERLRAAVLRCLDREAQRVDRVTARLGRPSARIAQQRARLAALEQTLAHRVQAQLQSRRQALAQAARELPRSAGARITLQHAQQALLQVRLASVDPALVLQRGYARLSDPAGRTLSRVGQMVSGSSVIATLADGTVDLSVQGTHPN